MDFPFFYNLNLEVTENLLQFVSLEATNQISIFLEVFGYSNY